MPDDGLRKTICQWYAQKMIKLNPGQLQTNIRIPPGWVTMEEMRYTRTFCELVTKSNASVLEIGGQSGRMLVYLHMHHPEWTYSQVDDLDPAHGAIPHTFFPWKYKNIRVVTEKDFYQNCPWATLYKMKFEQFESNEKFDIIIVSASASSIDWKEMYKKAKDYLNPNGIIIGRHYNHRTMGKPIRTALAELDLHAIHYAREYVGIFVIHASSDIGSCQPNCYCKSM